MKRNLTTRSIGSVLVLCQNKDPPSDAEWAESIRQLRLLLRAHGGEVKAFVSTNGGAPNPEQRGLLQKELAKTPIRTAVLSDSLSARMTSSTVALANRYHRSFGVADVAEAYAYLGLAPDEIRGIEAALKTMSALLD
jgi:hypothetical protein